MCRHQLCIIYQRICYAPWRSVPHRTVCYIYVPDAPRAVCLALHMCASDVLMLPLDEQFACRGMVPLAKCAQLIWAVRAVSI